MEIGGYGAVCALGSAVMAIAALRTPSAPEAGKNIA
jgi:hypothetical protein